MAVIALITAPVTTILLLPRSAPKVAGHQLISEVWMRSTISGNRLTMSTY